MDNTQTSLPPEAEELLKEFELIAVPLVNIFARIKPEQLTQLIESSSIVEDKQAALKSVGELKTEYDLDRAFNRIFYGELYTLDQLIKAFKAVPDSDPDSATTKTKLAAYEKRKQVLLEIEQQILKLA